MTTQFKVNDLVSIVAQPNSSQMNSHIHMMGLSGYIEEIIGDYAQFVELREDGLGGLGGVPLSCLKLENDNKRLQDLKQAKEERFLKLLQESSDRTRRHNDMRDKAVDRAAKLTGVSTRNVMKIFEIYEEFNKEWDQTYGWQNK